MIKPRPPHQAADKFLRLARLVAILGMDFEDAIIGVDHELIESIGASLPKLSRAMQTLSQDLRRKAMTPEQYEQEYECSFDAAIVSVAGSFDGLVSGGGLIDQANLNRALDNLGSQLSDVTKAGINEGVIFDEATLRQRRARPVQHHRGHQAPAQPLMDVLLQGRLPAEEHQHAGEGHEREAGHDDGRGPVAGNGRCGHRFCEGETR